MSESWNYVPFSNLFSWCQKSNIGSRQATENGEYSLYIASATEIKKYNTWLESGEALIFGTGGNPCIHYVTGKYAYTNHTEVAKALSDNVVTKFYYYYFQRNRYSQLAETFVGGGIKNSSKKKIGALLVPQIEKAEQERIVSHIEELFSQLDDGVETMKKTKEQLAMYRQAVLKEAFSEFTEKKSIRDVSELVTSGSRGWAQYYSNTGARFIRITDLTRDRIELKNDSIQYVDLPEKAEGKRSRLIENDVLVSITADLGSIALISGNIQEAYINQHIALIRFDNPFQGAFMAWYLKSDYGQKDLLKNRRGGGKLGLGLDDIRNTPVPVVSDKVALSVVADIDSKLSVCDSIKKTVDVTLQQADAMRQSILQDAFEGRL